jgi:hypothetical protein
MEAVYELEGMHFHVVGKNLIDKTMKKLKDLGEIVSCLCAFSFFPYIFFYSSSMYRGEFVFRRKDGHNPSFC